MVTEATKTLTISHPLEPLTSDEIKRAVEIVRAQQALSEKVRFVTVTLQEPAKNEVLDFRTGDAIVRRAFMVLLKKDAGALTTYEAVVNVSEGRVDSWRTLPGVHPSIMFEEFFACEDLVKANPEVQAALAKRGITNMDLVYVDPWSAGNYGTPEELDRRVLRTTVHVRLNPDDPNENSYAHPVEGLHALVDLNTMHVVHVDDFGVIPVPKPMGNYTLGTLPTRTVKPLEINQPEGPSFAVDGHHITWDNWTLRIGFSPREGLILYNVGFRDQDRVRPILYRAALAEMVVPYGDVSISHSRQNAFDVGEYGVGWLANSLELGCDCLGTIHYFDADMADADGNVLTIPNAICMHEEDYGLLWKHTNFRTNHVEVRRSRRLVISFIATVGIYEYGFFWYFYQDGSIHQETKLTGIMNVGAVAPGSTTKYGQMLNDQLYSPVHQHFFCFRLDTNVAGPQNSIVEQQTVAVPKGPENPFNNAFYVQSTSFKNEQEVQRDVNAHAARSWVVINPNVLNHVGQPVGYQLLPGSSNVLPFANEESSFLKRAGFTKHHIWATPYDPSERYPAGEYPNQHIGGDGLPQWTQANRSIDNTNLVLWHTVGVHHAPRLEDWPVMPAAYAGFMLRPHGFFKQNPALDVAPQEHTEHGDHCEHRA